MTTDLVEKCARAAAVADGFLSWDQVPNTEAEAFKSKDGFRRIALAVIDALADGVSDEMVKAASDERTFRLVGQETWDDVMRRALSAAIRAAKSREGTPPPPKD